MTPSFTLAAGVQEPIRISHSSVLIRTVVYLTEMFRKVPKVSTSTLAYYSTQVCSSYQASLKKRWSFRKTKWSHYITLTNKLARTLLPLNSPDMDHAYQCDMPSALRRKSVSHVADEIIVHHVGMPSVKTSTKHFCNTMKGMTLVQLQLCLPGLRGNGKIDGLRLFKTLTFHTLAG